MPRDEGAEPVEVDLLERPVPGGTGRGTGAARVGVAGEVAADDA